MEVLQAPVNAVGSGNDSVEGAGGNMFEIGFGTARWRVDGTNSAIWEFCKSYADGSKANGAMLMSTNSVQQREPSRNAE
jgi:hypothetical protein